MLLPVDIHPSVNWLKKRHDRENQICSHVNPKADKVRKKVSLGVCVCVIVHCSPAARDPQCLPVAVTWGCSVRGIEEHVNMKGKSRCFAGHQSQNPSS